MEHLLVQLLAAMKNFMGALVLLLLSVMV